MVCLRLAEGAIHDLARSAMRGFWEHFPRLPPRAMYPPVSAPRLSRAQQCGAYLGRTQDRDVDRDHAKGAVLAIRVMCKDELANMHAGPSRCSTAPDLQQSHSARRSARTSPRRRLALHCFSAQPSWRHPPFRCCFAEWRAPSFDGSRSTSSTPSAGGAFSPARLASEVSAGWASSGAPHVLGLSAYPAGVCERIVSHRLVSSLPYTRW